MIPVSSATWQGDAVEEAPWQTCLREVVTDIDTLCDKLALPLGARDALRAACQAFPLRVPLPYLQRMQPGNLQDPLLLQVLPQARELLEAPGFVPDPLQERHYNPVSGLVHKYGSRVLLVTTQLCAIHCRYCFRREFPYQQNRNSRSDWQLALDYIVAHPEVNEVILSGGDPLSLPDRQLAWLCGQIEQIPHIRRLRLHTRLPIVIPQRVCDSLLDWLAPTRLQKVVVVHCNHPQELDEPVKQALHRLTEARVTLLNQSVLLANVNDHANTLANLSETLFAAGVLPYYLHMLDRVRGSQHFDVSLEHALALHKALQTQLPGFLVPTLVREEPGQPGKTRLA